MKRKTVIETIDVPLIEDYENLPALEILNKLNGIMNTRILPVTVNPGAVRLRFNGCPDWDDTCSYAVFEFERRETNDEFELRKSNARAKRRLTQQKIQQNKDAERAEYERLKKIYG